MIKRFNIILCLLTIVVSNAWAQSFRWESSLPEEEGFSSAKLYAVRDSLAKHGTAALLVIRYDRIVLEWYGEGWHPGRRHYTASLAKAIVGGTSLLLALHDGRLHTDDPAWKYIPGWKDDPLKSQITIRHLATHSSGLEDAEISEKDLEAAKEQGIEIKHPHMDIPGWKGGFWRHDPDPFSLARDSTPALFRAGSAYEYSNPGMAMLSYAITASYKGLYPDLRTLLRERLYKPIGIKEGEWSVGYGKTFTINGLNLVANWGGGEFTPRAVASIGRLMLRKGNWGGQQLIDSSWVEEVTRYAGTPLPPRHEKQPAPAATLCWYNNRDGIWPQAPRDTYVGAGAGNQVLIVIPSLNMILVRNGQDMYDSEKNEGFFYGIERYLVNGVMESLIEPPYPKSEVITGVTFAPKDSIVRKACGSDNWPVTWGDDDLLYTAYGDGWGFEPKVEKKLSLGLARIDGGPENFQGVNLRSQTGERLGDGRTGKKASGMLMVDGVLYMWLRNANEAGEHSQLAWSDDHGRTWLFSDWKFTEGFGYPTFLNFGKNYHGARDGYVYIYSHDDADAYVSADQMVLARVPEAQLTLRTAYQFFKGLDAKGEPVWTDDMDERGPVFKNPGSCYRSGITYNTGLKRYLWCQVQQPSRHPQGVRFQGGFGIYEASEPWGPWRTVYYTKDWDAGPGETSSFPTKWMSNNGKTCYLVFSGDDCFSVRKVVFETAP